MEKNIVNEKSLKLKHFDFRMNQWTKLLSVYSKATLEYLELIKTNTDDLLYRCSG